jgi:hypothetical protein
MLHWQLQRVLCCSWAATLCQSSSQVQQQRQQGCMQQCQQRCRLLQRPPQMVLAAAPLQQLLLQAPAAAVLHMRVRRLVLAV